MGGWARHQRAVESRQRRERGEPEQDNEKELKYPSNWGPYEVLYCVSEGYKRFCQKYETKVPLEGLQANQILRVRFDEQGSLEPVSGREPWSFPIEPGKGITENEVRNRDAAIRAWTENVPPEPDWENLREGNYTLQEDLPEDPAEDEPIFALGLDSLELTDEQKAMLQPPETRIRELLFPASIQARARKRRISKKTSKWAEKFRGVFSGKFHAKWAKRTRAQNEEKARGIAKAKAKKVVSFASSLVEKIKKKQKEKAARNADRPSRRTDVTEHPREATEKCEASPWHDKEVRVVSEGTYEGQRGVVTSVLKYITSSPEEPRYRLQLRNLTNHRS